MAEDAIRVSPGRPTTGGTTTTTAARRRGLAVPTEVLVLAATALTVLVAAAIADNFTSPYAWGFVTALAFAYIISRGLVKRGTGDYDGL